MLHGVRVDMGDMMEALSEQMTRQSVLRRVRCVTHHDEKVDGAGDETENEQDDCDDDEGVGERQCVKLRHLIHVCLREIASLDHSTG